jgi:hypothetical protein
MGFMRLLPGFIFVVLMGAQLLFLSDQAYAYCSCWMACPSPRCPSCNPNCAVSDSFANYHRTTFQIRSVHSTRLFASDSTGNDNSTGFRLIAVPQALLKLQCERIKEILNWVSDLHVTGSEFQGTLQ